MKWVIKNCLAGAWIAVFLLMVLVGSVGLCARWTVTQWSRYWGFVVGGVCLYGAFVIAGVGK